MSTTQATPATEPAVSNMPAELWGLRTEEGYLLRHLSGSYHAYATRLGAEGAAARLTHYTDDLLTPHRIK